MDGQPGGKQGIRGRRGGARGETHGKRRRGARLRPVLARKKGAPHRERPEAEKYLFCAADSVCAFSCKVGVTWYAVRAGADRKVYTGDIRYLTGLIFNQLHTCAKIGPRRSV